ncbi:10790_t:CDS:2, partial [Gigaspora rosea]
ASNTVERQMAPLSHDLARIILSHNTFGSHLDEQLKTANDELEKHNFKAAGEILASVWENTIIDKRHTIACRYITQIVKCNDTSCCKPFRSRILQLLPIRFFPPPILVQQKSHGICVASINASDDTTHFSNFLLSTLMPGILIPPEMNLQHFHFDWYSPTIDKSINEFSRYRSFSVPIVVAYNYQYDEFLVSNDRGEAMWIEEDTIPKDAPESLFQEVKHIRTNQNHKHTLLTGRLGNSSGQMM